MSIASIHQPNYLPWLGYFHKISYSEVFVFLDSVIYSPKTYTNRCFVVLNKDKTRVSIPVKVKNTHTTINKVGIDTACFARKHLETFRYAYGKSRYYKEVLDFLKPHFEIGQTNLADFNMGIIQDIANYIGFSTKFIKLSNLNITTKKNQLLIDISKVCNIDIFVSGIGAKEYIANNEDLYFDSDIKLCFQNFIHPQYWQKSKDFIAGCSILDLIFNHGKNALQILTQQEVPYKIFEK